jgi:hypothetical protein
MIAGAALALAASIGVADAGPPVHTTHATGAQETVPVDTNAQGQLVLRESADGTSIDYRLIVANISDVTMSHLHLAPAGSNGGIVVWLYPSAPPPSLIEGRTNGALAEGTITAGALTGALAGQPLSALIDAMRSGNTYVNVHTLRAPGGEVRGQID